ncbi:MAG TPA: hypothetical protein VGO80_16925 [Solirubrobacteraceae bacterium]|nr:hypothetical protein [Solirubrobacteraceae bacterium]
MKLVSSDDGFSVLETMLAAALGLILISAALLTLDRSFKVNMQVSERVDSSQRARQAMDTITRQLRSAVCPDPLTAALVAGTDDSVTFYVDLGDGSKPVARHVLSYDSSARAISELRYDGSGMAPSTTWPASPTASRVLIENVVRLATTPVFRFNAFDSANPPAPTVVLPTPLTTTGIASASRITISFVTRDAGRSSTSPQATPLQDQVDLRSADPNQPKPAPQCT